MGNIQTSKRKYQTLCRWPRTNSYDYQWESVLYTCWIYEYWDNQVWNEGTMNYLTTLFSYRFLLKITLPSRITNLSATCIDHIFVRIEDTKRIKTGDIASGLLFNDITDHLPCFISIKCGNLIAKNDRPLTRVFGDKNCKRFIEIMQTENWQALYTPDVRVRVRRVRKLYLKSDKV